MMRLEQLVKGVSAHSIFFFIHENREIGIVVPNPFQIFKNSDSRNIFESVSLFLNDGGSLGDG